MARRLAIVLGLALVLPALAQDDGYDSQYENGPTWGDAYDPEAAPPDDGGARVDVNVDMGTAGAGVTFETFRDGLAPYGEWVNVGAYGRVWRPAHVAAGWRPYYYGRWQWTDEGWLWDSEESWGWATYHYGRWAHEPTYGWIWVPGYQWAPAWVTWRYSPEYVGWAPLAPGFSVYVSSYPFSYSWWNFVPCRRFAGVPVYSVAYTGGQVRTLFRGTQPAPPRASVYGAVAPAWGGPARPFVERSVGHAIAPVRLQPVGSPSAMASPARAGVVSIYRPDVRPAPAGRSAGIAPSRPWGAPSAAVAPGRAGAAPRPSSAWRGGAAQAPVGPRSSAQPPGRYAPAPRQYGTAPRQYGQASRQYAPVPGGGMRPRGGELAPRAAPSPRGGGAAPRGGGGGGHPDAAAPHRR